MSIMTGEHYLVLKEILWHARCESVCGRERKGEKTRDREKVSVCVCVCVCVCVFNGRQSESHCCPVSGCGCTVYGHPFRCHIFVDREKKEALLLCVWFCQRADDVCVCVCVCMCVRLSDRVCC